VVVPKVMMDPDHHIFAHNAGVFTLFKKEIPPLSPYTIQTRIWTWNEKWLFLQHRFLLDEKNIVCVAVSKIVFKRASGKTVPPMNIFDLCGHIFNNEYEDIRKKNWETAHQLLSMDKLFGDEWDGPVFASKL
jgi:hypothetical protein